MSLTIAPNDLKFVIFASGHDYTLADSGDGDIIFFSHPFVPLNSVNRAGQYYFLVPDENGDPIDAVKDDIAHCTFTPALGTAFDTEGEATVEVHYHREYIYDEETLVVDKTVSQKITVVNHGTVTQSETYYDLYSDGYGFYRPSSVNTADYNMTIRGNGEPNKLSSIPWRVSRLGNGIYSFCQGRYLSDISELQYADVSGVVAMDGLFNYCPLLTIDKLKEAIGNWNVENLAQIYWAFNGGTFTDLSFLEKWTPKNLTSLDSAFYGCGSLTSLHGLEHFDTSNLTTLRWTFYNCQNLTDLSAIANWNVSNVVSMERTFNACYALADLTPLANWNVSNVSNMTCTFVNCSALTTLEPLHDWTPHLTAITQCFGNCSSLTNLKGLENFDVSNVTVFSDVFQSCYLKSLTGLENWNVGNGRNFNNMFQDNPYLTSILPLKDWDMSKAQSVSAMFGSNGFIQNVDGVIWDISSITTGGMFTGHKLWYSSIIDKVVMETWWYYYDIDGNAYMGTGIYDEEHPLVRIWKDASEAENWTVGGSNLAIFNTAEWNNIPAWN